MSRNDLTLPEQADYHPPTDGAEMFNVSLSAFQTFQRCEQSYSYSYVDRLRPIVPDIAPLRGIILHEYMSEYYQGLKDGQNPDEAHAAGIEKIESYRDEIRQNQVNAEQSHQEKLVEEYKQILPDCLRIAERYYAVHGRRDADVYDVLLVEERLEALVAPGIKSTAVVDLVLRHRDFGTVKLVEHKTTNSVPSGDYRLRDTQTLLYASILYSVKGIEVDEVLWNYLLTKRPDVPDTLKDGSLSRRKTLNTTWEVYLHALEEAGLDPADYADVEERLRNAETSVFFPRFSNSLLADPEIVVRDYTTTAIRMRRYVWEWKNGVSQPVRSLSRNCDWCGFNKLCTASLMGGDEEEIIKLYFRASTRRNGSK